VLYVLDGDITFGVAAHMGWMMVVGQDIQPMIIVGIGWHIQSFDDWNARRSRDFMPEAHEMLPASTNDGAANFLAFIETELIPFVSTNYRTDADNQNLWGHSGGGSFALFALLQRPGLFRGIVSGSPAIWPHPHIYEEMEKKLFEAGKTLPVKLYVAFGALEGDWVKPAEDFYRTLANRNYAGFTGKYELLDGETHTSVIPRLFVTGLREIMKMDASPTG
jgi:predicted alpha/beta superfamily hydrolase